MQELLLRHEKATDAMIRKLEAQTRRIDAGTEELKVLTKRSDEGFAQLMAQSEAQRREFVEESRAQRAALFRILDRFDQGGSPAGS
jgi:hypothetical protein